MAEDPVWGARPKLQIVGGLDPVPAGDVDQDDGRGERTELKPVEIESSGWVEEDIKDREWLVPGHAMRGVVTIMAGPPGAGKSIIAAGMAIAAVLGRPYGRFKPVRPLKVALYNAEDDLMEQKRRLSASLRQFGVAPSVLEGKLFRMFPPEQAELFQWGQNELGGFDVIPTPQWKFLNEFCGDVQPDLLFLDPAAELSTVPEKENEAQRSLMARYRGLAHRRNLSVFLLDHTPKNSDGKAGDANIVRGAGAKVGSSRIVLTCTTMTELEARAMDVSEQGRHSYVRVTDAKANYSAFTLPQWYEKTAYILGNNEEVAAAVPWVAPIQPEPDTTQLQALMTTIGRGRGGEPYSPQFGNAGRSIRHAFRQHSITGVALEKKVMNRLLDMGLILGHFRNASRKWPDGIRTPDGLPKAVWQDLQGDEESAPRALHDAVESAPRAIERAPREDSELDWSFDDPE